MKQAVVFLRGVKAGILTEDENGYTFEYNADYLPSANAAAVSLTLPLSEALSRQGAVPILRWVDSRRLAPGYCREELED